MAVFLRETTKTTSSRGLIRFVARVSRYTVATALALSPVAASAAVMINVERLDVVPTGTDQTVYLDVFLVDLDNTNELLSGFGIVIDGPANTLNGVRFTQPVHLPTAAHPFVFRDMLPGSSPGDFGSNHSQVIAGADVETPGFGVDVSDVLNGLFAVQVLIPADARPGDYPFAVHPEFSALSTSGPPLGVQAGPPGGVTVVPEPLAFAAAIMAALPLLRRRRPRRR